VRGGGEKGVTPPSLNLNIKKRGGRSEGVFLLVTKVAKEEGKKKKRGRIRKKKGKIGPSRVSRAKRPRKKKKRKVEENI